MFEKLYPMSKRTVLFYRLCMYIFLTVLTPPVLCYGLSTHDNIGSQQTMICNDLVTFALDSNCQVNVLPEALLETPANNNFTVEIYYNSNL